MDLRKRVNISIDAYSGRNSEGAHSVLPVIPELGPNELSRNLNYSQQELALKKGMKQNS